MHHRRNISFLYFSLIQKLAGASCKNLCGKIIHLCSHLSLSGAKNCSVTGYWKIDAPEPKTRTDSCRDKLFCRGEACRTRLLTFELRTYIYRKLMVWVEFVQDDQQCSIYPTIQSNISFIEKELDEHLKGFLQLQFRSN